MARPRSVTGSGRVVKLSGVKELAANVRDLKDIVAGFQAQGVIADATEVVHAAVVSKAQSVGVPHEVMGDIFTYKKPPRKPNRREISALVGIRKRGYSRPWAHAYREWHAGSSWGGIAGGYLRKKGKAVLKKGLASGKVIGESLATMWELGTSKMRAKPFFRPALNASRLAALGVMTAGFTRIIKKYSK